MEEVTECYCENCGAWRDWTRTDKDPPTGDEPFVCADVDQVCVEGEGGGGELPMSSPAGEPFPTRWCPRGEFVEYPEKPRPTLPGEFMSSFHSGHDLRFREMAASSEASGGTVASTNFLANVVVRATAMGKPAPAS